MPTVEDVATFIVKALEEMNLDIEDVGVETMMGPSGVDLDSLALAELVARLEDGFGATFPEDEVEEMAIMTLGEFAELVVKRSGQAQPEGTPS